MGNSDQSFNASDVLVADLLKIVEVGELEQRRDKHVAWCFHVKHRADAYGAFESHQAQVDDLRVI